MFHVDMLPWNHVLVAVETCLGWRSLAVHSCAGIISQARHTWGKRLKSSEYSISGGEQLKLSPSNTFLKVFLTLLHPLSQNGLQQEGLVMRC
jgi:hypothetical protein